MYLYYLCFKNVHRSCSKISSPSIIWSCKLFWYYAMSLQKICAWFLSCIWYIHLLIIVGYVSGQWHRPGYRLTLSLGSRCPLESTAFRQVDLKIHCCIFTSLCGGSHVFQYIHVRFDVYGLLKRLVCVLYVFTEDLFCWG